MSDLIERLEKAAEGGYDLDCAVALASGWLHEKRPNERRLWWRRPDAKHEYERRESAPPFTTSLDAALALAPEGWRCGMEQDGRYDSDPPGWLAWVWPYESAFEPDWQMGSQGYRDAPDGRCGFAPTPALALCIAALKARSEA